MNNLKNIKIVAEKAKIDEGAKVVLNSPLNEVPWFWQGTIKRLIENWITSTDDLRKTDYDKLKKILGNPISIHQVNTFLGISNN
jgi:nucleotidyltransferase/DNA polymerase involved in DNA repair